MSLKRTLNGNTLVLYDGKNPVLVMKEEQKGEEVIVTLEGSLNSRTVYDFQDEMMALAIFGVHLKLDFANVTNISSACSHSLLKIQQKIDEIGKGSLVLLHVPSNIYEEMETIGMTELLMIED